MVKIVNYNKRKSQDRKPFFILTVQGGIEMVRSQNTGDLFATAKKATIPSTFDEDSCNTLVVDDKPGMIIKPQCDPFEYTIKDTGEIIILSHKYAYVLKEDSEVKSNLENVKNKKSSFSLNGILKATV